METPRNETTADWRPIMECPRFDICSAPICPLDRLWATRWPADPDDETCKAKRSTREEIASRYPALKNGGLTQVEITNDQRSALYKARLAAMTPEDMEQRLALLAEGRARGQAALQARRGALKVGPPVPVVKG